MSANNHLVIEEQNDGSFTAFDRSVEGEGEGFEAFRANNLQEATEKAQEYSGEQMVEYGYQFVWKPKEPSPEPGEEPKYAYWYELDALRELVHALSNKVEALAKRL